MDGREVKALRYNGTIVSVVLDDSGDYLAFLVAVYSGSPHRLVVNPASAFVRIQQPKPNLLLTIPSEKVAKSMEKRRRWRSMLASFLAGMATRTSSGTITDEYGNQSTVTLSESDKIAQRNAREADVERRARNQTSAEIIREIGLRSNTVFPKSKLMGWIFFEKKKFTSLSVGVFTGEAMFEFPFRK